MWAIPLNLTTSYFQNDSTEFVFIKNKVKTIIPLLISSWIWINQWNTKKDTFVIKQLNKLIYFFLSFQTVAYSILWDIHFLLRNFALIGALLLVVAESRVEGRSLFAGVPSLGENKPKNFLQLTGRILLAFMFITLLRFEFSVLQIIQDIFGSILMVFVTIGYKTKLSALALVLLLSMLNLYYNAWWSIPSHKPLRDFLKYDFFQVCLIYFTCFYKRSHNST